MTEKTKEKEKPSENTTETKGPEAEASSISAPETVEDPEKVLKSETKDISFSDPSKSVVAEKEASASAEVREEPEESDDEILRRLLKDEEDKSNDIEQRVLSKIERREELKQKSQAAWSSFYSENPDLKEFSELVDVQRDRLLKELKEQKKDIPWEDGAKIVAKRSRDLLKSIRSTNNEEIDVDSSDSVVSSSSHSTPPQVKKPEKVSFVDQLNKNRQFG